MTDSSPNSADRTTVWRYPGVRSFEDDPTEQRLFYGREAETYDLAQLIRAERLVVLFARSGVGKSSLINAGLLPELRSKGFFPMVARVASAENDPLDSFYRGVQAACEHAEDGNKGEKWGLDVSVEPREPTEWLRSNLWRFFKSFYVWRGETELLTPVVIFDQFEELFTLLTEEQRRPFIEQLADLIRGTGPGGSTEERRDNESALGARPPDVSVVLTIREDFMAHLEEMAERIPAILKARFRLGPLDAANAKLAIVEPAKTENPDLATRPFEWSNEALDRVLAFLRRRKKSDGSWEIGDHVEPFQLQLVCQYVEGLVHRNKLKRIEIHELGGDEALRNILTRFYRDVIDDVCEENRRFGLERRLRTFCEAGLLTATGRRLLREESTIVKKDGISADILSALVERRLLRKERRLGDNYYELTHDTLIDPILASRQRRERKERRLAMGTGIVALVAIVFGTGYLFYSQRRIEEADRTQRAAALVDNGLIWGQRGHFEVAAAFNDAAAALAENLAGALPLTPDAVGTQVDSLMREQSPDTAVAREARSAINEANEVFGEALEIRDTPLLQALDALNFNDAFDRLLETGNELAARRHPEAADSVFRAAAAFKDRLEGSVDSVAKERLDSLSQLVRPRELRIAQLLARGAYVEEARYLYNALDERYRDERTPAEAWNTLCWKGGLFGDPLLVREDCVKAVELAQDEEDNEHIGMVRDSRGLVLALTGGDLTLAKEDFSFYVEWSRGTQKQMDRREAWIRDLEEGRNPFTPDDALDSLRQDWQNDRDLAQLQLLEEYVPSVDPEESLVLLMEEWYSDPIVLERLRARPAPLCRDTTQDHLATCDSLWSSGELPGMEEIADNPCSDRLKHFAESAFVGEVLITDSVGFNVCMSQRTEDYYQADEGWWWDARNWELNRNPYRPARRSTTQRDRSARQLSFVVYTVVMDPESDEFLGVIKGVFDHELGRARIRPQLLNLLGQPP